MKQKFKKGIILITMLLLFCGMSIAVYANSALNSIYPRELKHHKEEIFHKGYIITLKNSSYIYWGDPLTYKIYIDDKLVHTFPDHTTSDQPDTVTSYKLKKDLKLKEVKENIVGQGTWIESGTMEFYFSTVESTPTVASIWRPTTPEDLERYSYFVSELATFLPGGDASELYITNAVQGPACIKCMKIFKPKNYEIAATYNILPSASKNSKFYHSDKEYTFTMKIPDEFQKEGRTFIFLCISEDGMPYLYKNNSLKSDRITITTDRFYAYALLYSDQVK